MSNSVDLNGIRSVLQKVVFEVQYENGFAYLDTCGRILNHILEHHDEWTIREQVNPQSGALISLSTGTQLIFGPLKLDLSLEKPVGATEITGDELDYFVSSADELVPVILERLGVHRFPRIGFRIWFLFPTSSDFESSDWIKDLGAFSVSQSLIRSAGTTARDFSFSCVIASDDRDFRITFNSVRRNIQIDFGEGILNVDSKAIPTNQRKALLKNQMDVRRRMRQNPESAAMIDIDASIEDQESVNSSDFITTSLSRSMAILNEIESQRILARSTKK